MVLPLEHVAARAIDLLLVARFASSRAPAGDAAALFVGEGIIMAGGGRSRRLCAIRKANSKCSIRATTGHNITRPRRPRIETLPVEELGWGISINVS